MTILDRAFILLGVCLTGAVLGAGVSVAADASAIAFNNGHGPVVGEQLQYIGVALAVLGGSCLLLVLTLMSPEGLGWLVLALVLVAAVSGWGAWKSVEEYQVALSNPGNPHVEAMQAPKYARRIREHGLLRQWDRFNGFVSSVERKLSNRLNK